VLADRLERIALDESRHFFFYYRQAEIRMRRRPVARAARFLAPICSEGRKGGPPRARWTRRSVACPVSRECGSSRRGLIGTPQGRPLL
jgi:hypothetical protein